ARVAEFEGALEAAEAKLPALEEERLAKQSALQDRTRELAQAEAALSTLQAQQAKLDHNSRLGEWTASHGLERAERLWQAIQVEAGWDDAIEAAL
ncbi:MAG TPA: hypothetical protein PLD37_12365, partial [Usitatibacteraceae bacterium]|nr:hypothetical protein [Usitatibacteraceae bacterium]